MIRLARTRNRHGIDVRQMMMLMLIQHVTHILSNIHGTHGRNMPSCTHSLHMKASAHDVKMRCRVHERHGKTGSQCKPNTPITRRRYMDERPHDGQMKAVREDAARGRILLWDGRIMRSRLPERPRAQGTAGCGTGSKLCRGRRVDGARGQAIRGDKAGGGERIGTRGRRAAGAPGERAATGRNPAASDGRHGTWENDENGAGEVETAQSADQGAAGDGASAGRRQGTDRRHGKPPIAAATGWPWR